MKILGNIRSLIGLTAIIAVVGLLGYTSSVAQAQVFRGSQNAYVEVDDNGSTTDLLVIGAGGSTKDGLVAVIKGVINWTLGILAFIALIVLLYGGFLMVTAAGESDRYDKGFTILKQAAVGLVIIGVARFIVSIIFRLINLTAQPVANTGAGTEG